ncbi:Werner helicase interacting protein 1 [Perkinsus olseni]|uniref:Werner helicase interacting protein 1 n=1 Tax=Perkinsus olseni TaxID=32597 RepID=A0A7J6LT30_PEROL|nr:Werner helicase interacting protein 1 [Perkinsus olseni]
MGSRAPPTKRSRCSVGQQGMRTLDSFFAKKETASHATSNVEAIDIEASQSSSGPDSRRPKASEHPAAGELGSGGQTLKPKIALRPKSSACRPTSDSRQGGPLAQRARPTSSIDLVYEAGSEREGTGNSVGGVATIMRIINYYEALPSIGADTASTIQHQPAVPSMILWGPPGCGKTTLAQLLCRSLTRSGLPWRHTKLSAVNAGVNDVKKVVEEATNARRLSGGRTLLFLDEIHRFNKAQQDALLPHVENGTLTLIGATTENPSFQCNRALVSRCQIIKIPPLSTGSVEKILRRALSNYYPQVAVDGSTGELLKTLAEFGMGDVRASLNALELACDLAMMSPGDASPVITLRLEHVKEAMETSSCGRHRLLGYDKNGDIHYDLASALQKSIRGSDKDAAAYWTTRMLHGGEPPEYVSRRLMRIASEDVGLADPQSLQVAAAAHTATMATGMPECSDRALAALYLCDAPKSNAVYVAYKNATKAIENATTDSEVPVHLRNAPTGLMRELGYGRDYVYTNQPRPTRAGEMAPKQSYLPSGLHRGDIFPTAFYDARPGLPSSCPTCGTRLIEK